MEKSHPSALHLGFRAKNDEVFPAHILTAKKSELKSWDLCAFFSGQKISSQDKKSKDKERLKAKMLECTYLALDFEDDKAKEEFEIELLAVRILRQKQLNDAVYARGVAEREAQSPRELTFHSEAADLRKYPSLTTRLTNTSRVSVAPKLPPIVRESAFSMDSASIFSERTYLYKDKLG
jgi:hypothetical protein